MCHTTAWTPHVHDQVLRSARHGPWAGRCVPPNVLMVLLSHVDERRPPCGRCSGGTQPEHQARPPPRAAAAVGRQTSFGEDVRMLLNGCSTENQAKRRLYRWKRARCDGQRVRGLRVPGRGAATGARRRASVRAEATDGRHRRRRVRGGTRPCPAAHRAARPRRVASTAAAERGPHGPPAGKGHRL